jgi:hypothetical protein
VLAGTAITLPGKGDMAKVGETFIRWQSGAVSYRPGASYPVNDNVTLTAQWMAPLAANAVADYLDGETGSAADPIPLPVGFSLAGSGWSDLLAAINSGNKYVALDLSGCTMSGTEFDPDNALTGTAQAAKALIVSLVLPSAATSIAAGDDYQDSTFKHFTALKTVSGAEVVSVGNYAFYGCTALASVSLPQAQTIGQSAFSGCTALASVSLPQAQTIGTWAFYGCTALASVDLSAAQTIREHAFSNCTALTSVDLSSATSISYDAFADTGTTDLIITLGTASPTVSNSMFSGVNSARTVTVEVPSGATGYGATLPLTVSGSDTTPCWANGFRGAGWAYNAFVSSDSYINQNITLTITAQP